MATATPRRFSNQCEMSAISGAKVAAALKPTRTWAAANRISEVVAEGQREAGAETERADHRGDDDAMPVDDAADDHAAGEEAQHVHRIGERDSARLTPRSACTAGIATASAHMPMPPSVLSVTLIASRRQA